jgi:hypothetical protein
MTTTQPHNSDPDQLVARALSALPRAEVPAGLADRAFAAAMQAPPVSTWTDAIFELFQVARVGAMCAASVAAVLVVGAAVRPATTSTAATASSTSDDAEWVAAVLPGLGASE